MKVRQIKIQDNDIQTRAFAGSIGSDLSSPVRLTIVLNGKNIDTTKPDKNIVFEMTYDSENDEYAMANETCEIHDDILSLHYDQGGAFADASFIINDESITLQTGETCEIEIDNERYEATDGRIERYFDSIFIDKNNEISDKENACAYAIGAEAVRQYLLQHLQVIKNELWYNYEYGLPLFQKGLTKAMIDAEVALIISECADVEAIETFKSSIDEKHDYHLSFSVLTKYGKLDLIDTL